MPVLELKCPLVIHVNTMAFLGLYACETGEYSVGSTR